MNIKFNSIIIEDKIKAILFEVENKFYQVDLYEPVDYLDESNAFQIFNSNFNNRV